MPRNIERDKREADRRKNQLIEAGFRLFSQNGIETVSLQKVADAANVSPATMYKYFLTKEKLLIAISAKVWDEVWQEALGDPGTNHFEHFTAYQGIEFYADRMIALYKNRPEVLRFSSEYKTYMNRRGNMEDKQLREHLDVLKPMQLLFHGMYERAKVDGSIRTDIPEEEMFITSSITMLSMAERYAQGLVWLNDPKDDHTQELLHLKEMLLLWCQGEKRRRSIMQESEGVLCMRVSFRIALAGQVIGVSALYEQTRTFCKNYLTDAPASFEVAVTPADIAFEREKNDREAAVEGHAPGNFSDEYLETLALYRKIVERLLEWDTLLFHGSCISVDSKAYLFTAKSGTGKSTHTQLWKKWFGERAVFINDDKPLLKISAQGVTVYGTPWDGKHHRSTNTSCPLKAVCILTRNTENSIQRIDKKAALPMLCQQSYRPCSPIGTQKMLALVNRLGSSVPLYRLGCNMEPEAALVAYHGMNQ